MPSPASLSLLPSLSNLGTVVVSPNPYLFHSCLLSQGTAMAPYYGRGDDVYVSKHCKYDVGIFLRLKIVSVESC